MLIGTAVVGGGYYAVKEISDTAEKTRSIDIEQTDVSLADTSTTTSATTTEANDTQNSEGERSEEMVRNTSASANLDRQIVEREAKVLRLQKAEQEALAQKLAEEQAELQRTEEALSQSHEEAENMQEVERAGELLEQTVKETNPIDTSSRASESASTPTVTITPSVKFSANPSTIEYGGSSVLSWAATGALSCTFGSSTVLLDTAGSQSVSPKSSDWSKLSSTTYIITCTGAGGSVSEEVTVTTRRWVPSEECEAAAEATPTVNGNELNPILCSKLTM